MLDKATVCSVLKPELIVTGLQSAKWLLLNKYKNNTDACVSVPKRYQILHLKLSSSTTSPQVLCFFCGFGWVGLFCFEGFDLFWFVFYVLAHHLQQKVKSMKECHPGISQCTKKTSHT